MVRKNLHKMAYDQDVGEFLYFYIVCICICCNMDLKPPYFHKNDLDYYAHNFHIFLSLYHLFDAYPTILIRTWACEE